MKLKQIKMMRRIKKKEKNNIIEFFIKLINYYFSNISNINIFF